MEILNAEALSQDQARFSIFGVSGAVASVLGCYLVTDICYFLVTPYSSEQFLNYFGYFSFISTQLDCFEINIGVKKKYERGKKHEFLLEKLISF